MMDWKLGLHNVVKFAMVKRSVKFILKCFYTREHG